MSRLECSAVRGLWREAHLVVPLRQIQLGKYCTAPQAVQGIINTGDGKVVNNDIIIECAVIDAEPLRAIFFACEQDGMVVLAGRRNYPAFALKLLHLFMHFF